jgi:lipid A ethanolaminephosphotransferase
MFAPVGRRQYDEARIRGSESLLHVVARAGVAVQWRDNQSGCKGVCEGLPQDTVSTAVAPGLCQADRCFDEGLLRGLDERLRALHNSRGTQLLVLHMLGNHGPSYYRRYPPAFERFTPVCRSDDLGRCTREEIVNAYDNALLYTDHVLATLIGTLSAHADQVDTALLFVSDHGESLGEKNLFLHGVPYVIAPREQTQVPMIMWWSNGFGRSAGLDTDCMRTRSRQPAEHDNLFHTVLALLDVKTSLYTPALDVTHDCRPQG